MDKANFTGEFKPLRRPILLREVAVDEAPLLKKVSSKAQGKNIPFQTRRSATATILNFRQLISLMVVKLHVDQMNNFLKSKTRLTNELRVSHLVPN